MGHHRKSSDVLLWVQGKQPIFCEENQLGKVFSNTFSPFHASALLLCVLHLRKNCNNS